MLLEGIFSDDETAKNHKGLPALDKVQLGAKHVVGTAEHVWDMISGDLNDVCTKIGDFSTCFGASLALTCVINVPRIICEVTKELGKKMSYYLLVVATIAFQVVDDVLALATLGG